ncbi:WD repeat-containing protein 44-like [Triticum dicoccoides]|uniref:WD repeat-containing protein 44-like n=1 Tax=Triticum dicoccoides TaxID=85692 RepID=UPI00189017B5|nr:WD repeat-containing protein 44-like [Triticum dicoccoides]
MRRQAIRFATARQEPYTMSHDNGFREAATDDDDGCSEQESFFQCLDRVKPPGDGDPVFPSDDGEEDGLSDAARVSFATAVDDRLQEEQAVLDEDEDYEEEDLSTYDYDMWMEADEPVPIKERRRRLLHGMGLNSSRDILRSRIARTRNISRRPPRRAFAPSASSTPPEIMKRQPISFLKRCRSDSRLAVRGAAARKLTALRRVHSAPHSLQGSPVHRALRPAARCPLPSAVSKDEGGGENRNCNLDDGKVFVVNGTQSTDGARGAANDAHGYAGYTPLVKQIMRRSQSQTVKAGAGNKDGGMPTIKKPRWLKNMKLVATVAALIHEKDRDRDRDRSSALPSAMTMSKSKSASAAAAADSASTSSSSTERLKVHHSGKSSKDLTGLYMRQEVRAHEGSIWSIKFSADAQFLASGGEDRVVLVWQVVHTDASSSILTPDLSTGKLLPPLAPADGGSLAGAPGLAAQLSRKVLRGKSSKHVLPEHVVLPETVFALAEQPVCVFEGHEDDVLDLSWSKQSSRLLSSSMDKTVRLWDVESKACLQVFAHSDYVTCIQFNPADEGYFISGSLDCRVRVWSVAERQVVDWSDLNDMVTAASYTPDGQAAIVGSHKGCCRFYKTRDCKLNQEAQIDMSISKKRKSQAKKITGFQFAPGNPSEILVTSADSQIRVFNGITVLQKFKGFKNTSSQLSASYSGDGRYVVCASEDSHVYVWRRAAGGMGSAAGGSIGVKAKTWLTSRSYEYFFCRDVSAAVPWPGSPPSPFPRAGDERASSSVHGGAGRRADNDAFGDGVQLPPRPKSGPLTFPGSQAEMLRMGPSSREAGCNAWGMVVVTAGLGGEMRVYQNFGMPEGIKGQK